MTESTWSEQSDSHNLLLPKKKKGLQYDIDIELVDQRAFTNQIIKELDDRGLILKDVDPHTPIRGERNRYDLYESYTTAMGKKFLMFINENVDLHFNFRESIL